MNMFIGGMIDEYREVTCVSSPALSTYVT